MINCFFHLHNEHEDASIQMIDDIFEAIQQNYVNDDDKNFIKDLIKVKSTLQCGLIHFLALNSCQLN